MENYDARLSYIGAGALIAGVFAVKELVLRYASRPWAVALFGLVLAAAVPAARALDPDWDNLNVRRVGIWVGTPIGLLAVPLTSFLFDLGGGAKWSPNRRLVQAVIEFLVAVPLWFFFWTLMQVFVFHWVWI